MNLQSAFIGAAAAMASCAAVHVAFAAFGVEPLFHALGEIFDLPDLSETFGVEAGGHVVEEACHTDIVPYH